MESTTRLPEQKNITEIIPKRVISEWVRAKNSMPERLLATGNKVIDNIGDAIKTKYLPTEWNEDIKKLTTACEVVDYPGSKRKEKCILYWTIERYGKKIHLPVIAIHGGDGTYTRSAVDTNHEFYFMYDRWLDGGKFSNARIELNGLNEQEKSINLLREHGFVNKGEVAPSQLQVSFGEVKFVGENHYEYGQGKNNLSSLKGLTWKLEKHTATSILPQFVIKDLGLLNV